MSLVHAPTNSSSIKCVLTATFASIATPARYLDHPIASRMHCFCFVVAYISMSSCERNTHPFARACARLLVARVFFMYGAGCRCKPRQCSSARGQAPRSPRLPCCRPKTSPTRTRSPSLCASPWKPPRDVSSAGSLALSGWCRHQNRRQHQWQHCPRKWWWPRQCYLISCSSSRSRSSSSCCCSCNPNS